MSIQDGHLVLHFLFDTVFPQPLALPFVLVGYVSDLWGKMGLQIITLKLDGWQDHK